MKGKIEARSLKNLRGVNKIFSVKKGGGLTLGLLAYELFFSNYLPNLTRRWVV